MNDTFARESSRIHCLDGLRGLSALLVVIHHYSLITLENADALFLVNHRFLNGTLNFFGFIGHLCVWFFFILSGYSLSVFFSKKYAGNYSRYLGSRLIRLYFPIEMAILLTLLTMICIPRDSSGLGEWVGGHPEYIELGDYLRDITIVSGTSANLSPLWSMQWEIVASVVFPGIYFVSRRLEPRISIVLAALAIGYCGFIELFPLCYIGMFLIGAMLQNLHELRPRKSKFPITELLCALFLVLLPYYFLPENRYFYFIVFLVLPVIGMTLILNNCLTNPRINSVFSSKWLKGLGKISFSLYLTHEIVLLAFTYQFSGDSTYNFVALGLVIPVAVVFYFSIEKTSHQFARSILSCDRGEDKKQLGSRR